MYKGINNMNVHVFTCVCKSTYVCMHACMHAYTHKHPSHEHVCPCICVFSHVPTGSADMLKCIGRGWGKICAGTTAAV